MQGWGLGRRRKLKQSTFLVFNQQFLTLIRAEVADFEFRWNC